MCSTSSPNFPSGISFVGLVLFRFRWLVLSSSLSFGSNGEKDVHLLLSRRSSADQWPSTRSFVVVVVQWWWWCDASSSEGEKMREEKQRRYPMRPKFSLGSSHFYILLANDTTGRLKAPSSDPYVNRQSVRTLSTPLPDASMPSSFVDTPVSMSLWSQLA